MDVLTEVVRAERRIRRHVRQTPLEPSLALSELGQAGVQLKCENLQHTGSFKVRGALNALLSLPEERRAAGVVTASTGNHGAAVAWSLRILGASGIVFVPENASPTKVEAIRRFGAEVRPHGNDAVQAEEYARDFAGDRGLPYISPYNDSSVIGGQGTIAVELCQQTEHIDAVFVPVGGGGLISGIAGYLKTAMPGARIVGCQPATSAVMAHSVAAGHILDMASAPTLSDATAGGIEPGAVTFDLCRALVDEFVQVAEDEIAAALRLILEAQHLLVEGGAAVAVAAYLQQIGRFRGQDVVIVLSGANIGPAALRDVLSS